MVTYDVVVIGGGHAGTEAAAAAARMGARTLLLTQRLDRLGELSCNPSIGGIGKSHLVREIDALDGLMAKAADAACIHNKVLNKSKGPAVQGVRIQADRALYRVAIQELLTATPNLELQTGEAAGLLTFRQGNVSGITLRDGSTIASRSVVVATGTFLQGVIHIGLTQTSAGRVDDAASQLLAVSLRELGLPVARLKTGTPPRLARSSIYWDELPADWGDNPATPLSFMTQEILTRQIECRVTGTTIATHQFIKQHLSSTALYGGAISSRGPRYCPSIEDKVVRFAERDRHQIFLEPEGLPGTIDGETVYPNGISTSLPEYLQAKMLQSIPGLENVVITRPGYAIEYDFVQPTALDAGLQVRTMQGLFLAGQINGTTGYEEAAAQGILAGINAARYASGLAGITLDRTSSYIGVMVDDLTSRGVSEPYRMFTSRAEFRLRLRCDNADLRLTPIGMAAGCVSASRKTRFTDFAHDCSAAIALAQADCKTPSELEAFGISVKQDGIRRTVLDVLNRDISEERIQAAFPWLAELSLGSLQQLQALALYGGYLKRQDSEVKNIQSSYSRKLANIDDYDAISGLSTEAREALKQTAPLTLGDLASMRGITASSLAAVAAYAKHVG